MYIVQVRCTMYMYDVALLCTSTLYYVCTYVLCTMYYVPRTTLHREPLQTQYSRRERQAAQVKRASVQANSFGVRNSESVK